MSSSVSSGGSRRSRRSVRGGKLSKGRSTPQRSPGSGGDGEAASGARLSSPPATPAEAASTPTLSDIATPSTLPSPPSDTPPGAGGVEAGDKLQAGGEGSKPAPVPAAPSPAAVAQPFGPGGVGTDGMEKAAGGGDSKKGFGGGWGGGGGKSGGFATGSRLGKGSKFGSKSGVSAKSAEGTEPAARFKVFGRPAKASKPVEGEGVVKTAGVETAPAVKWKFGTNPKLEAKGGEPEKPKTSKFGGSAKPVFGMAKPKFSGAIPAKVGFGSSAPAKAKFGGAKFGSSSGPSAPKFGSAAPAKVGFGISEPVKPLPTKVEGKRDPKKAPSQAKSAEPGVPLEDVFGNWSLSSTTAITGNVSALFFVGPALFCAGWDRTVRVWNGVSNTAEKVLASPILGGCIVEGSEQIAFACLDGALRVLDASRPTGARTKLDGSGQPIQHATPCGRNVVAVTAWDNCMRAYDLRANSVAMEFNCLTKVYALDVETASYTAVVARANEYDGAPYGGKICTFDLRKPDSFAATTVSPLRFQTSALRVMPGLSQAVVGSPEGRCAVHVLPPDRPNKQNSFTFKCHRLGKRRSPVYTLTDIQVSPANPTCFATVGTDGTFRFWNSADRQKLNDQDGPREPITKCAFDATGRRFAYAWGHDWGTGAPAPASSTKHAVFVHNTSSRERGEV